MTRPVFLACAATRESGAPLSAASWDVSTSYPRLRRKAAVSGRWFSSNRKRRPSAIQNFDLLIAHQGSRILDRGHDLLPRELRIALKNLFDGIAPRDLA